MVSTPHGGKGDGASITTIAKPENVEEYLYPHAADKQYHPTAEQLKVRKARHRRSGSHGSGNFVQLQGNSPRISPLRERRVGFNFSTKTMVNSLIHLLLLSGKLKCKNCFS